MIFKILQLNFNFRQPQIYFIYYFVYNGFPFHHIFLFICLFLVFEVILTFLLMILLLMIEGVAFLRICLVLRMFLFEINLLCLYLLQIQILFQKQCFQMFLYILLILHYLLENYLTITIFSIRDNLMPTTGTLHLCTLHFHSQVNHNLG